MQSAGTQVFSNYRHSVTPTLGKRPEPPLFIVSLRFAQDSPRYRFAEWMNLSIQLPLTKSRPGAVLCAKDGAVNRRAKSWPLRAYVLVGEADGIHVGEQEETEQEEGGEESQGRGGRPFIYDKRLSEKVTLGQRLIGREGAKLQVHMCSGQRPRISKGLERPCVVLLRHRRHCAGVG